MNKDNKKLVVESVFIKEALKRKLSLEEFLLLLYFDNSFDSIFDVPSIAKTLKMNDEQVLDSFSKLMDKNLIKVDAIPNTFGKVVEHISLDNYYNCIVEDTKKIKKEETKNDIFSVFEKEFGRTLSGMDYEIIKAWMDKGFSEELILGALNEASYNGVTSLRYIDKILFEWNKKGFKTMDDVKNHLKTKDTSNLCETKVLNFDWLDDNE
jgi:DNA replication protein